MTQNRYRNKSIAGPTEENETISLYPGIYTSESDKWSGREVQSKEGIYR